MLNKKIALHCARYINLFLHLKLYIIYNIIFFQISEVKSARLGDDNKTYS